MHVAGGAKGTTVAEAAPPSGGRSDVRLTIAAEDLLGFMAGRVHAREALVDGRIEAEGDLAALDVFSELFDVAAGGAARMQLGKPIRQRQAPFRA